MALVTDVNKFKIIPNYTYNSQILNQKIRVIYTRQIANDYFYNTYGYQDNIFDINLPNVLNISETHFNTYIKNIFNDKVKGTLSTYLTTPTVILPKEIINDFPFNNKVDIRRHFNV